MRRPRPRRWSGRHRWTPSRLSSSGPQEFLRRGVNCNSLFLARRTVCLRRANFFESNFRLHCSYHIHQWNPEATRFPTMCNTCAAAHSKTVRTGLTFCHAVRHVYSCTLCTTVPGHTVVYPVCGEYQAGAACRFQTAVPRTEKMSARTASGPDCVLPHIFSDRGTSVCNRQVARAQEVYTTQTYRIYIITGVGSCE
jgi:hypothetical protein